VNSADEVPAPARSGTVVTSHGLWKSYGSGDNRVDAVRDVSLDLGAGQVTALVGASGSGKSTLLHLLSGLAAPTKGTVRIGERDLAGMSEAELAHMRATDLGFVLQRDNLIPTLNLAENVAAPLMLAGVRRRQAMEQARAALAEVGLAERADHWPSAVSGGEAARAAIARALVVDPIVLFADEPTGALDTRTGQEVVGLLVDQAHRRGAAAFVVTHDREVAGRADRILAMRDGQAIASPQPDNADNADKADDADQTDNADQADQPHHVA
jgi:ABC-type lipoprotein export system ATPase subunit